MSGFAVPARLAYEIPDDEQELRVFLRHLPGGPNLVLEGSGALIWYLATQDGDVPGQVADLTGQDVDDIRGDVLAFLDTLVSQNLLARSSP